jgi:hypothetical protein
MGVTQLNIFQGSNYNPTFDHERLSKQIGRIEQLMIDFKWRTLKEMETELEQKYPESNFPQASISAQLRNLVKTGVYTFEKRVKGDRKQGLWEYKLIVK